MFGEFAERGFTDAWFAEMIVKYHGDTPVETVSYDSAPVEVRARAANAKRRLARIDPDQPPPSPITIQGARTAEVNMAELPVECEWGCKRDSQGKKKQWKGGKIHAAVTRDGARPEMGRDTDGDGVERPDRPRKLCLEPGAPLAHWGISR